MRPANGMQMLAHSASAALGYLLVSGSEAAGRFVAEGENERMKRFAIMPSSVVQGEAKYRNLGVFAIDIPRIFVKQELSTDLAQPYLVQPHSSWRLSWNQLTRLRLGATCIWWRLLSALGHRKDRVLAKIDEFKIHALRVVELAHVRLMEERVLFEEFDEDDAVHRGRQLLALHFLEYEINVLSVLRQELVSDIAHKYTAGDTYALINLVKMGLDMPAIGPENYWVDLAAIYWLKDVLAAIDINATASRAYADAVPFGVEWIARLRSLMMYDLFASFPGLDDGLMLPPKHYIHFRNVDIVAAESEPMRNTWYREITQRQKQ